MNTKVRFVRCPRCKQVLPELVEISLYKCGGCGTILQAKIPKKYTQDTGSPLHGTDPTQKKEMEHVSEEKQTSSLNQQATIPSTKESALDKSSERDQNEFRDCKRVWFGGMNHSDELPTSTELSCHENLESLPHARADMEADEDKSPLDQYDRSDQNDSSSTELNRHENLESLPQARADMKADEDKTPPLDQYDRSDQNDFEDYNGEQPEDMKSSYGVSSSTELIPHENGSWSKGSGKHIEEDESKYSEQKNGRDQNEFGDFSRELPGNIKISEEISSSSKLTCQEIKNPSQVAGADIEVDEILKSRFIFRSSSEENLVHTRSKDSIITVQRPLGESILSDNLMYPYNEQMKRSQNSILQGLDRVSSVDTLENMPLVNPSSEICVKHGDMSKSPTTRSYYAYDGSVSSCNETDDQVPNRHFHHSKRNFKDADFGGSKRFPKRGEFMWSNLASIGSEMQHQVTNSSSILPGKKDHASKGSKWHRDEFLAPTRHGHPVRSMMGLETDEHPSRLKVYPRGSHAGHGNGIPSSYRHKEFKYSLSNHSPDKPEYPESDKMDLLKMVYELQDELNRLNISKGKANRRFPAQVAKKAKQNSSCYDHLAPERETYPGLNHPRYTRRYKHGQSWSQEYKIHQRAFSGDATRCRLQADCSCLHHCSQEWHCSPQMPRGVICCNKGHYAAHPSHNCFNSYHSGPSSPQHYAGSEFSLWNRDSKSDDQKNKDHEMKMWYLREKNHSMKRHSRPIAGGAPIIVCYRCSKLLQLPADFLLFGRRCHRLRCSACSEVLKFSLQNKTHVVPYIPDVVAPPPSEVDDNTNAIKNRYLASSSSVNDCPHAEPMSCSDDYDQSLCKSCSTEGDPFSLTPTFHTLGINSNGRKMSSRSSFEPMEKRKNYVLKESQNKYKNHVEIFDSAGPLSMMPKQKKSSSKIEELPPKTRSPLHRLMGYSSPSIVING